MLKGAEMKKRFLLMLVWGWIGLAATWINAQTVPETLLPKTILNELINEVSGAVPTHHLIELGGYARDRQPAEYQGTYFESQYVLDRLQEYGVPGTQIETLPATRPEWDARRGELWTTYPEKRLIISFRDENAALAVNSASGTYKGKLIYVGLGTKDQDYAGKEIAGNFILGESSPAMLYRLGVVKYKAVGVIAFAASHPFELPDKITWQGLPDESFSGKPVSGDSLPAPKSCGFNLSMRLGTELKDLVQALHTGEKIEIEAIVAADSVQADHETVTALIPGVGSNPEEIVLTAHLFEGVQKQGANDNFSGCVAILEVARTLTQLVRDGSLPPPKRSIRFLWVPEISGSLQYLLRHPEESKRMVANINLDMVGENVRKNYNSLKLYLNPCSRAHCIDYVAAELFDWVGLMNRELIHNRQAQHPLIFPIYDVTGSRDPFLYNIEPNYGASDHIVFLMQDFKIPAVFFNNWPDMAYHTSADRPDLNDPTQLKRVAFLATALTTILADYGQNDFAKLAGVCYNSAVTNLTHGFRNEVLALAATVDSALVDRYRDSRYILQAHLQRQLTALSSVAMFYQDPIKDAALLNDLQSSVRLLGNDLQNQLKSEYKNIGEKRKLALDYPTTSPLEMELARQIPTDVVQPLPPVSEAHKYMIDHLWQVTVPESPFSREIQQELRYFVDGKRSLLQIRNSVSAEYEPLSLQEVQNFFRALEKKQAVRLSRR